jgi:O-antigen ligase
MEVAAGDRRIHIPGMIVMALAVALAIVAIIVGAGPEAALLVGIGVLALIVAAIAPGVPLAIFFLIPVYKGALQPYSPIDVTVLLAMVNALQIVPVLMDRRHRNISWTGIALWGAMGLLVLVGVIYAPDGSLALDRAITAWALLFIPVIPAALRIGSDERFLRQVVLTFLVAGLLVVALGLLSFSGAERLTVLETNTINTARAALIVPLLAMMFVPQMHSLPLRVALVMASLAAVLVGLATGSRGPVVFLLLMGGVGLLRSILSSTGPDRRTAAAVAIAAIACIAIIASGAIDLPAVSTARFSGFGDFLGSVFSSGAAEGQADTSSEARLMLFGFAVELFAQSPIFGVGTAGYQALSPDALGVFEANIYPHNALLQIASEYGLVGVALMGTLVIMALTRRLPTRTYGHGIRLLFIYYLLNGMVSGDVLEARETWGLMMLILLIDVPLRPLRDEAPPSVPPLSPGARARPAPQLPLAWPVPPAHVRSPHPGPYATPFEAGEARTRHPL